MGVYPVPARIEATITPKCLVERVIGIIGNRQYGRPDTLPVGSVTAKGDVQLSYRSVFPSVEPVAGLDRGITE